MALKTASTWAELSSLTSAWMETRGTAVGELFVGVATGGGASAEPPGSGSGPDAGGMVGTGGGPSTAWGDVPSPGPTAVLALAGEIAASLGEALLASLRAAGAADAAGVA